MDPSGLYVASSSSEKTVYLFDFYSGECLAKLYGHSGLCVCMCVGITVSIMLLTLAEVVTQVKFTNDCKFLYSVSGDG